MALARSSRALSIRSSLLPRYEWRLRRSPAPGRKPGYGAFSHRADARRDVPAGAAVRLHRACHLGCRVEPKVPRGPEYLAEVRLRRGRLSAESPVDGRHTLYLAAEANDPLGPWPAARDCRLAG